MANSDEEKLFQYAMKQIDEVPVPTECWTVGGGTALKYEMNHRESKDIDLFFEDPQYLGFLSPRFNDANELDLQDYKENANGLQLRFPEGKVDFVVAGRVTNFVAQEKFFHGRNVFFDDSVEIVAKKIFHRADYFHPRDCFDLAGLYLSDRKGDLIDVGAAMSEKIEILKKRLDMIEGEKDFFRTIVPLSAGTRIIGKEMELTRAFIRDVEARRV